MGPARRPADRDRAGLRDQVSEDLVVVCGRLLLSCRLLSERVELLLRGLLLCHPQRALSCGDAAARRTCTRLLTLPACFLSAFAFRPSRSLAVRRGDDDRRAAQRSDPGRERCRSGRAARSMCSGAAGAASAAGDGARFAGRRRPVRRPRSWFGYALGLAPRPSGCSAVAALRRLSVRPGVLLPAVDLPEPAVLRDLGLRVWRLRTAGVGSAGCSGAARSRLGLCCGAALTCFAAASAGGRRPNILDRRPLPRPRMRRRRAASPAPAGWPRQPARNLVSGAGRQTGVLANSSCAVRSSAAAPSPNTRIDIDSDDRGEQETKAGEHGRQVPLRGICEGL